MSATTRPFLPTRYRRATPTRPVVAALVDDGTAAAVAAAAVSSAAELGAPIRFVQLVGEDHHDPEADEAADHRMFLAAMHAVRGANARVSFEVVGPDGLARLLEESVHAALLVVADDGGGTSLARSCLHSAPCPVFVVGPDTGSDR